MGAGRVGTLVARRLLENPDLGLRPVAFLDKEPLEDTQRKVGLPVVGASWDLDEAIERYGIEQVIVTFSTAPEEVLLRLVRRCEERRVPVAIVPRKGRSGANATSRGYGHRHRRGAGRLRRQWDQLVGGQIS